MVTSATARVLAIVPAYNESANLPHVIGDLRQHCPDWDVVVVDDGSRDATGQVATVLGAVVLQLPFNLGIGGAVQTGLIYADRHGYEVAVQLDGDGQHNAREAARLVDTLLSRKADVVVGSRFFSPEGFRSTMVRRFGIRILCLVIRLLTRSCVTDPTSGQRALGRRAISLLACNYPQEYPEPETIYVLRQAGCHVIEVPVTMNARRGGRSSIRALDSLLYMVKVLLAILVQATRSPARPKEALP